MRRPLVSEILTLKGEGQCLAEGEVRKAAVGAMGSGWEPSGFKEARSSRLTLEWA